MQLDIEAVTLAQPCQVAEYALSRALDDVRSISEAQGKGMVKFKRWIIPDNYHEYSLEYGF